MNLRIRRGTTFVELVVASAILGFMMYTGYTFLRRTGGQGQSHPEYLQRARELLLRTLYEAKGLSVSMLPPAGQCLRIEYKADGSVAVPAAYGTCSLGPALESGRYRVITEFRTGGSILSTPTYSESATMKLPKYSSNFREIYIKTYYKVDSIQGQTDLTTFKRFK